MKLMMSQTVYACNGSLALNPEPRRLRLIEGGLSHQASAPQAHHGIALQVNLLSVVMALMAALAITWYATDCYASSHAARMLEEVESETIVVAEGDTLWGIAEARQVEGCTTEQVVRHIREVNGLDSSMLREGTTLRVPCMS